MRNDRIGNCKKHHRRHVWQCPDCRAEAGKAPMDPTLDQVRQVLRESLLPHGEGDCQVVED